MVINGCVQHDGGGGSGDGGGGGGSGVHIQQLIQRKNKEWAPYDDREQQGTWNSGPGEPMTGGQGEVMRSAEEVEEELRKPEEDEEAQQEKKKPIFL